VILVWEIEILLIQIGLLGIMEIHFLVHIVKLMCNKLVKERRYGL